jgi:hypothetical protein
MAENWSYLSDVRIKLSDPSGVIALVSVADYSSLPVAPASQTAYRTADTGVYYVYDSGTTAWSAVDLLISDNVLNKLIESSGVDKAVQRAISIILAGLYPRRQIVKTNAGAESTEYQSLTSTIAFYQALKSAYKEEAAEDGAVSTGRIVHTCRPAIGGFIE